MKLIFLSLLFACSGKSSDTGSEDTGSDTDTDTDTDTGSDTDTDSGDTTDDGLFGGIDYVLIDSQGYTPISESIYLSFPSESEFQFSGDCNSFFGEFSVDGSTFATTGIGGTEIGCSPELMAEDEWLVDFFLGSPTFDLQSDSLSFEKDGVTLVFGDRDEVIPDAAFEETVWVIDTFIDGDAVSAYNLNSTPSVRFGADGQIDLNTGCNGGLGEYTLNGDSLSVTMTAYTDAFCDDDNAQAAESIIVSVFMGPTVELELNEDRLTLTNGDRGIGAYASE